MPDSRAYFHSSCCGFLFEGKTSTPMKEFQNGKMSEILGSTPPTAIVPPFQDVAGCLCSVNNYETYDWLLYPAWLSNKIAERETISSWGTNFLTNIVGERVSSGLLGLRIAPLMSSSTASHGYPGYSRMFQIPSLVYMQRYLLGFSQVAVDQGLFPSPSRVFLIANSCSAIDRFSIIRQSWKKPPNMKHWRFHKNDQLE